MRSEVSWSPDYLVLAVGNDDGYVIPLDKQIFSVKYFLTYNF